MQSLAAVQPRAALTDRLSLIATKDGFIMYGSDVGIADDGWADVAAGLEIPRLRRSRHANDHQHRFDLRASCRIDSALQGNGDGEFNLFHRRSAARLLRTLSVDRWNSSAIRSPVEKIRSSIEIRNIWTTSSVQLGMRSRIQLVSLHERHSGRRSQRRQRARLYNLGSSNVAGLDIVIRGFGLKKKFGNYNELGAAYEIPITDAKDLFERRFTFDITFRY